MVKGVLTDEEVKEARSKYWDKIESLSLNIKRDQISTWVNQNWPSTKAGFTTSWGISHCDAAWFLRTRENVIGCFANIWKSYNLISSFDTFLAWRPWWFTEDITESKESWKAHTEGIHCDQNPFFKKGLSSVQAMLPLYDVNEETGGLEVVANTNTDQVQAELRANYPDQEQYTYDWELLHDTD